MTWERALEADARLAARNAVLIRAALRQSFDAERAFIGYQNTMPDENLTLAQQRVRSRAWAIMNIRPNLEPLRQILYKLWAEGYALGDLAAREAIAEAQQAQKADVAGGVDWSKWKPGDATSAILLKPPRAFQRLIEGAGITLKGFSDTTLTDIGNAIGEAIELGLDARTSAKNIMRHVANPARALTIAITEQNRAISTATMNRYLEAGIRQQKWLVFDPCKICAQNENVKVGIGAPFPSGHTQTPAHPNCRCTLAPVLLSETDPANTAGSVELITPPATSSIESMPYVLAPKQVGEGFSRFDGQPLEVRKVMETTLNESFKRAANNDVVVNISPKNMKLVLEEGRLKSAFEKAMDQSWSKDYMEERKKIETIFLGIPESTPNITRPIYGSVFGDASMYGSVRLVLKDNIKGRTTLTAGDSFAKQNPVKVTDILEGKATVNDYTNATQFLAFEALISSSRVPEGVYKDRTTSYMKNLTYWEAQIHGGVTLNDVEKVLIDPKDWEGMQLVPELEKKGIKVEYEALYR